VTVRSMTGFGRAHAAAGRWSVDVAIRTVNHRFLDLTVRLREEHAELEPPVRKLVSEKVSRGKTEVAIRTRRLQESVHEVEINESLLVALLERFTDLSGRYPIGGRLEVRDLLTVPEVVRVGTMTESFEPEESAQVLDVVGSALDALLEMRAAEGRLLAADVAERLAFLKDKLSRIAASRREIVERLRVTLQERLAAVFPEVAFDPGRLEQEAAMLADRSDIAEEITRLDSHLAQFSELLVKAREPIGKKLDFLVQEIQREIHTIGSKCRDLSVAREVIDMKTETEKIREQVQNIE